MIEKFTMDMGNILTHLENKTHEKQISEANYKEGNILKELDTKKSIW